MIPSMIAFWKAGIILEELEVGRQLAMTAARGEPILKDRFRSSRQVAKRVLAST